MGRFDGSVVMVTGSAQGIGAATVARFVSEGARVAAVDIDTAANESMAASVIGDNPGAEIATYSCDVADAEAQGEVFADVVRRWSRLDVLVTSAGIYVGGPLEEIPMDRWESIVAVNLTGVLVSNRLAAGPMKAQGSGAIVNIASMAAKTSWPESAEYSATKSGVVGITRSAAMELGPHGITVNALCPGNTLTAMVRKVATEIGGTLGMTGSEWLEMRAADTALGRLAEPWEMAGIIAFLASPDARYITGQAIEADGGLILS